jgi:hypothetical protein
VVCAWEDGTRLPCCAAAGPAIRAPSERLTESRGRAPATLGRLQECHRARRNRRRRFGYPGLAGLHDRRVRSLRAPGALGPRSFQREGPRWPGRSPRRSGERGGRWLRVRLRVPEADWISVCGGANRARFAGCVDRASLRAQHPPADQRSAGRQPAAPRTLLGPEDVHGVHPGGAKRRAEPGQQHHERERAGCREIDPGVQA